MAPVVRALIADRGVVARRLIEAFREEEVETVSVFSEPDVEQPWVDEADYGVYLNGATPAETYLHFRRVVSSALDAGCEAVHPGTSPLAQSLDLHDAAANANLLVLGTDTALLKRVHDRMRVVQLAASLRVPTIPCSSDIPDDHDPELVAQAAEELGFPLWIRSTVAPAVARLARGRDDVVPLLAAVRAAGGPVFLEAHMDGLRTVASIVVADEHGSLFPLGTYADSVGLRECWWVAEMGPEVVSEALQRKLSEYTRKIAEALDWVGIGTVRWAITPTGGCHFVRVTPALPQPWLLADEMLGVDLLRTQIRLSRGEHLAWDHADAHLDRHGLVIRLVHGDPRTGARPVGTLERLDLPTDVEGTAGTAEGQPCGPDTDPVLAQLVVVGPTRQATLVTARRALERTSVEGVPSNRQALLDLFGQEAFWRGQYDVDSIRRALG